MYEYVWYFNICEYTVKKYVGLYLELKGKHYLR